MIRLMKVIEEAERMNAAKYDKIKLWGDGCFAQLGPRFTFRLFTENLFKLSWYYNEKSH